ncbi:hypothetical protein IW262DRAFT_1461669 [Armillaria fumosa]|nr:hypothetical protein IW262DRAFT_1461669 [Armillaria fumosa]
MAWESLNFDLSLGALLASSWLNVMLYTFQVALSIYCLCLLTTTKWLRYWIFTSLVLDGACSIVDMANVYIYIVINNGTSSYYPTSSAWTVPTAALLTYTSASIAQAFFCYRYWTLSRNIWITGCIIFLITAHASLPLRMLCNLGTNIYILAHPSDTISVIPSMIANAAMCATTDITIAGSLVWACSRIQSLYKHTRNLLRRVMIQAVTCGFTTAIFTTLMIVFLFTVWNACFTIFASLGHIYSLTVLITVILLKFMRRSDPSCSSIDSDSDSGPVSLTPVGDIRFGHTSDAEAGKTQTSNDKARSENTRDSMHPHVETLAKAYVHTV